MTTNDVITLIALICSIIFGTVQICYMIFKNDKK